MTEYTATPSNISYFSGATGDPDRIAGTYPGFGRSSFDWSGDFTGIDNIVGFKVVFDASAGDGYMYWDMDIVNPGWSAHPTWTADTAGHIALHNSYAGASSAIHVNGPTHYEWRFYWPGDPTFGGFVFNDPLSDLLISLAAGEVFGNLEIGEGPAVTPIVVTRFDLVLFTAPNPPPLRRYPRSDGMGIGPTRHYPPPPSRRAAGGYR